ncbi:hypothetical protein K4L44_08430 [Halosquirtibacter laminarini]|uniref:Uncharacterized protein n=1 Tax=Halosquirtibacter laminarini TaxID=3374600 RepID=A0AC61NPF7_9BACT|nr:hypothetical protein K4L44_08430 [Prolixibacteraceae bacterium]
MDYGAISLRMITKYYGKTYSTVTMCKRSYISHEGVSLLGISEAPER